MGPDHITVQDFVGNPNSGKDVSVLLQVDGLEAGQVTFTVTRQSRNGQAGTQTITTNDEGIAEWRVTRDDIGKGGPPKGTYEVGAASPSIMQILANQHELILKLPVPLQMPPALANDTEFGLGGIVSGSDQKRPWKLPMNSIPGAVKSRRSPTAFSSNGD